jgi:hypothetical protein
MSSRLAEVQERSDGGKGFAETALPPAPKEPLASRACDNGDVRAGKRKWKRALFYGFHSTRFLRRLTSAGLTFAVWLFMVAFLLQFVRTHDDGKSLSEQVQTITNKVQVPLESVVGFDMRYEFSDTTVDFMPLFVFVALLLLRNRADSLLLRAERALKGAPPKTKVTSDLHGSEAHWPSAKGKLAQHLRRARGDDRAALSAKIYSIYSE